MVTILSHVIPLCCIILMFAASFHDIVARTIPNLLSVLLAALGLLAAATSGHLPGSLAAAGVVFMISAFCWHRGWMGGGDVKLLGAAALSLPPLLVPTFVAAVALSGGVLAIAYGLGGRVLPRLSSSRTSHARPAGLLARAIRVERWRISRGGPLPYACAIAAGGLFVLMQG